MLGGMALPPTPMRQQSIRSPSSRKVSRPTTTPFSEATTAGGEERWGEWAWWEERRQQQAWWVIPQEEEPRQQRCKSVGVLGQLGVVESA